MVPSARGRYSALGRVPTAKKGRQGRECKLKIVDFKLQISPPLPRGGGGGGGAANGQETCSSKTARGPLPPLGRGGRGGRAESPNVRRAHEPRTPPSNLQFRILNLQFAIPSSTRRSTTPPLPPLTKG